MKETIHLSSINTLAICTSLCIFCSLYSYTKLLFFKILANFTHFYNIFNKTFFSKLRLIILEKQHFIQVLKLRKFNFSNSLLGQKFNVAILTIFWSKWFPIDTPKKSYFLLKLYWRLRESDRQSEKFHSDSYKWN